MPVSDIEIQNIRNALTTGKQGVRDFVRGPSTKPLSKDELATRSHMLVDAVQNQLQDLKKEEKLLLIEETRSAMDDALAEIRKQADENMKDLAGRIGRIRAAIVVEEQKLAETFEAVAIEAREVKNEVQQGDWKTWAKYGAAAVGVGVAAKWIWDNTLGALWGRLAGDSENPGFFRRAMGWLATMGGAAIGALGLSKFLKDSTLGRFVDDAGDGAKKALNDAKKDAEKVVDAAREVGADLQKAIEEKRWDEVMTRVIGGGGLITFEAGKCIAHIGERAIVLPPEAWAKAIGLSEKKDGESAVYCIAEAGVSYVIGYSAFEAMVLGRIPTALKVRNITSLAKTAVRFAGGPLMEIVNVGYGAGASALSKDANILKMPLKNHWLYVNIVEGDLYKGLHSGSPAGISKAVTHWKELESLRATAQSGRFKWLSSFMLAEHQAKFAERANTLANELYRVMKGMKLEANAPDWLKEFKAATDAMGSDKGMRTFLEEHGGKIPNLSKEMTQAANLTKTSAAIVEAGNKVGTKLTVEAVEDFLRARNVDPKTIEHIKNSPGAKKLIAGAINSTNAEQEFARAIRAANRAAKLRIGLNAAGVVGDAFVLYMVYEDIQENEQKIKETDNPELLELYKNVRYVKATEGTVTAGALIYGTAVMIKTGLATGSVMAGLATPGSILVLPLVAATATGVMLRDKIDKETETFLRTQTDWAKMSEAQLWDNLIENRSSAISTAALLHDGVFGFMTDKDLGPLIQDAKAGARGMIIAAYLAKTAYVERLPNETEEAHKARLKSYVADQVRYIGRYTNGTFDVYRFNATTLFPYARDHAVLMAESRRLQAENGHQIVTIKSRKGSTLEDEQFDLVNYSRMISSPNEAEHMKGLQVLFRFHDEQLNMRISQWKLAKVMFTDKPKELEAIKKAIRLSTLEAVMDNVFRLDGKLLRSESPIETVKFCRYAISTILRRRIIAETTRLMDLPEMTRKDFEASLGTIHSQVFAEQEGGILRMAEVNGLSIHDPECKAYDDKNGAFLQLGWLSQKLLEKTDDQILNNAPAEKENSLGTNPEQPLDLSPIDPPAVVKRRGEKLFIRIPKQQGWNLYAGFGIEASGARSEELDFNKEGILTLEKKYTSFQILTLAGSPLPQGYKRDFTVRIED